MPVLLKKNLIPDKFYQLQVLCTRNFSERKGMKVAKAKLLRNKNPDQLNEEEWESLCNRCGACCLHKIQDVDTGDIYITSVLCEFYDLKSGKCSVYDNRFHVNPGCIKLTPGNIAELSWLPNCCNYRQIYEKRPLLKPHFFVSGKALQPWNSRLEQILGCEVVVYREDMDLSDYIIFCQCG